MRLRKKKHNDARQHGGVPDVSPSGANQMMRDGALLLDVREPEEWQAGRITGATHIPLGDLTIEQLPRDRPIVAVCRSGNLSGKAAKLLHDGGVDVYNLTGGMKAWEAAGLPFLAENGDPGTVA